MADILFIVYLVMFAATCILAYNTAAWNKFFPFYWKAKVGSQQFFNEWWNK